MKNVVKIKQVRLVKSTIKRYQPVGENNLRCTLQLPVRELIEKYLILNLLLNVMKYCTI
jgi:hypothetical protein